MELKNYKNIYMIGIGGISMSGIAEILKNWNYKVTGSDSVNSKQTDYLKENGIDVIIGQKKENITPNYDLVIYTAAIKKDNPEYVRALELGIPLMERGEFLGCLTKLFSNTIGISGTHGKTTTTSMVASIFLEAGLDPTIQVGAYLDRINGNYKVGQSEYFIIEACEYCDSYLRFYQKSAIVLNIDNDHLDYFKNMENIEKSFQKYVSLLPEDGYLILNKDDERCYKLKDYTKAKVITVGNDKADFTIGNVEYSDEGYPTFDVYYENEFMDSVSLGVTGEYNIKNALCAIALCHAYHISMNDIKKALKTFYGASRRMEYKGLFNGALVYDDYGHHPTEVSVTSQGVQKKKFHESWAVFETHSYSRLYNHLQEFADALCNFNHIIVTDIYAARETNTYNIKESDLIEELKKRGVDAIHISDYEDIVSYLKDNANEHDIILTIGAGNVTKLASRLVNEKDS